MRFSVFDQWGARNSVPVWRAFVTGAIRLGHSISHHDMSADIAVIWSQVWAGRMRANQTVWQQFRQSGRPVIVLEVGSLRRGTTWKMGVNGLGSSAHWGQGLDNQRPEKIGINLHPWRSNGDDLVILLQRSDSEQWVGKPPMHQWLENTVNQLRDHTDRHIRVRLHPRQLTSIPYGCTLDAPQRKPNTYDDYNLSHGLANAWAVINVNSGAGINSVLQGLPLFCEQSSLAAPVANLDWSQIESPQYPDRDHWLVDLCHTEWTREEIATGYPLSRLNLGFKSI